jgi:hypothetical protein
VDLAKHSKYFIKFEEIMWKSNLRQKILRSIYFISTLSQRKIEKTIVDLFDYRYNERMEAYNHIA